MHCYISLDCYISLYAFITGCLPYFACRQTDELGATINFKSILPDIRNYIYMGWGCKVRNDDFAILKFNTYFLKSESHLHQEDPIIKGDRLFIETNVLIV